MTSDWGPCPSSPTNMEYKPWFFDEPECLSSNKENILPLKSVTPPSLKNLSLEEGSTCNDTEATLWEASVAKKIMTTPRASSPYQDQPGTMEQLEPDTDNDIIDITDYAERPANDKRSPWHVQKYGTHSMTQRHCPHLRLVLTILPWTWQHHQQNPIIQKSGESFQTKQEHPMDGPHVSRNSHPG